MKIMITCKEVSELLSQAQDCQLSRGEKFWLNAHLLMCKGCRNFGKQLDFMRAAMRRYLERGGTGR
jgi:predicted anti-sigma-YlaC factor YlaD